VIFKLFFVLLYQGEPPSQELESEWQRSNELDQRRKNERRIREEVRYSLFYFQKIFLLILIIERTGN